MQVFHRTERIICRWAIAISWKYALVTFFCFVVSLYMMFTLINDRYVHHLAWYEQPAPCVTPQYIMDEMVQLTYMVSELLASLNVSHVLCYGTLWGALRQGKTLQWDNNVDFCLLKNEIRKISWATLKSSFVDNNMDISYNYRHGEYIITRGPAKAVLTVFYVTPFDEVFQDGFEHRFMWFFQDSPVSFPVRLLEAPFNKIRFHDKLMPVPHDGMEILKYLYKDDWWLEKPPLGCRVAG